MPGYKGHLVGGCVVYGALISVMYTRCPSQVVALGWLVCALAGSLFPDIDVKSKGQNYFYWLVLCIAIFFLFKRQLQSLAVLSIVSIIPMLVRHRGIFHRWWFIVVVAMGAGGLVCLYVPIYSRDVFLNVLFFIAGAFSHLWLDVGLRRMFKW